MKRLLVLVLVAGCRQILGLEPLPVAAAGDDDAPVDVPSDLTCFGTLARACIDTSGAQDLDLVDDIDTDTDSHCIAVSHPGESPDLCVIVGADVQIEDISATGSRALVIVSTHNVDINKLDVSSDHTGVHGAGIANCPSGDGQSGVNGGGGAGGSFGGLGGPGGMGAHGALGGTAPAVQSVTTVRGGCAGGSGGAGGAGAAVGGAGGGAVSIVAANRIRVTNEIVASGAGGSSVATSGGGGGGGSGGLIALEAPVIEVFGGCFANSGGGGEGAGSGAGNFGQDGQDQPNQPAKGGNGASGIGGDGGDGTAALVVDGATGANGGLAGPGGGGGGGGGGAGVVWVKGALVGTRISPPPEIH